MMRLRGADDGRGDPRPARDPGQGDLRRRDAELACDLLHPLGDRKIVALEIHALGEIVVLGAYRLALLALGHRFSAREPPACRLPGDVAHASAPAGGDISGSFSGLDRLVWI